MVQGDSQDLFRQKSLLIGGGGKSIDLFINLLDMEPPPPIKDSGSESIEPERELSLDATLALCRLAPTFSWAIM